MVNSHNHHHPLQDVIKYAEIAYLLNQTNEELERIRQEFQTERISVLMLGDYNSRPESATYAMVKNGVPMSTEDLKKDLDVEALLNKDFAASLLIQRQEQIGIYQHIFNKVKVNENFMKFQSAH